MKCVAQGVAVVFLGFCFQLAALSYQSDDIDREKTISQKKNNEYQAEGPHRQIVYVDTPQMRAEYLLSQAATSPHYSIKESGCALVFKGKSYSIYQK